MNFSDFLARWCINLSFILMSFCALYLASVLLFPSLGVEANATLASLLTIALSDLYLGFGRHK